MLSGAARRQPEPLHGGQSTLRVQEGDDAYRLADGRDRLAPQRLAQLANRYAACPAQEFLSTIVRDFVVNLHFKVARERAEAEPTTPRERYILVPGDEGIELNFERQTTFAPPVLRDRLCCAMLLLTQAGCSRKLKQRGGAWVSGEGIGTNINWLAIFL